MKRAERLLALTEALRRGGAQGVTADRLADEFGVSLRTVKRDVDALDQSGVPVWSRPGPGGGYGISAASHLPPINLSPAQAVALLAAVSSAADAPYADLAAAAARKIVDALDPGTRARADALSQRIWVNADEQPSRRVRSALEASMVDQRVVRITYVDRAGAETKRDVEPVIFAATGGRWYLIGWCRVRDAMRWFLLSRVTQATVTRLPCTGHSVEEIGEPPPSAAALGRAFE